MRELLIPKHVLDEIVALVLEAPEGLETGITLFGTSLECIPGPRVGSLDSPNGDQLSNAESVILAVAGPGRRATHEPAHYSGDEGHANTIYDALRSAMPGIRWLGELHVHPQGMTWLSGGDRRTVRQILTGNDDTLHPDEFIAGVMQRRNGSVDIYPFHFTREWLQGRPMEVVVVNCDAPKVHQARLKGIENARPDVCTEPEGSRTALPEAPGHHWLRKWWERTRRHGVKGRRR